MDDIKISQKEASKFAERLYTKVGKLHEQLREENKNVDNETLTRLFRLLPKRLDGKSVLDAGGGSGVFTQLALDRGAKRAVCLDISNTMLSFAKKRKRQFKLKRMEIIIRDLTKTKFRSSSFDIILAIYSLPHIADLKKTFSEFARILKRGGLVFIASDYYKTKNPKLIGTQIRYVVGGVNLDGIIQTKHDYTNSMKESGFKIKDFYIVKKAHGLSVSSKYKHKKDVVQHTFSAVVIKS